MRGSRIALVGLALLPVLALAQRSNAAPQVADRAVLVELFTSEGCSSCPPADEVLGRLAREQSVPGARVVLLSLHVDYWNDLGWADPFSSAQHTERQREYARVLPRGSVYTPQAVIAGQFETVGSRRREVEAHVALASTTALPGPKVRWTGGAGERKHLRVEVDPQVSGGGRVWLALTQREARVHPTRGENKGRDLVHHNVARSLQSLGSGPATFDLDVAVPKDATGFVVFLQDEPTKRIRAVTDGDLP